VSVADVGIDAIHVHNAEDPDPSTAFALSRLAHGPYSPTPLGIFRRVERPTYGEQMQHQLVEAQAKRGPGDLAALLASSGTWTA
jgi:2-oxoglutarate ferredoxin oxidoreductase subunit beta